MIGQRPRSGGVEIGEQQADEPHDDEFPAAEKEQSAADGSGGDREAGDAGLHGGKGDVAFGEGAVGAEPVGLVGAAQEVAEVVDQIGQALGQHGEKQAQQGDRRMEASVGPGHGRTDGYGDDRRPEAVGPYGEYPGGERVGFHDRVYSDVSSPTGVAATVRVYRMRR